MCCLLSCGGFVALSLSTKGMEEEEEDAMEEELLTRGGASMATRRKSQKAKRVKKVNGLDKKEMRE
jgi:hypothetical protein